MPPDRRGTMDGIGAGTWSCYAQARATRESRRPWPSVLTLYRLALSAGTDPWPLIVLCRGELPIRGREPVLCARLDEPGDLVVPTVEALRAVALFGEGRLRADLWSRGGRHFTPPLTPWAERWDEHLQEVARRREAAAQEGIAT